MSSLFLVTYHPAAILHAGKQAAGSKGLSKEAIYRAIVEDFQRVHTVLSNICTSTDSASTVSTSTLPEPVRVPVTSTVSDLGTTVGVDTEYLPDKTMITSAFSDGTQIVVWDKDAAPEVPPPVDPLRLVGHNLPEDVALLWENRQIPRLEEFLRGQDLIDTLLLSRMVYEGQASYKLEDLLASLFTINPWKHKTSAKDVTQWTPEERVERCGLDAWAPIHLYRKQWPLLDSHAQRSLYPFTMATAMTLHRLTLAGAFVEPTSLGELIETKTNERRDAHTLLVNAATVLGMSEFSAQNDGHIRELLFERLGLPVLERTPKTKAPKVSKDVLDALAELAEGGERGLLECLKQFNKLDKQLTTYLVGSDDPKHPSRNALQQLARAIRINSEGSGNGNIAGRYRDLLWLPFHFHVLGAKTARRSSSNPNSQNWPKEIRRLVCSRWPGGKILAADYRKLEPVIIAWLAQDEKLLEFFTTGGGYIDIAKSLLKTDVQEGTTLYRGVKSIVLGVHYDMGTEEMANQLWAIHKIRFDADWDKHWNETDRIRNLYLDTYPRIGEYMERRRAEARASGRVRTPVGRVRSVGKLFVDKHILNQAINSPVQSTASDVTGSALVDCERAILADAGISLTEWYDHLLAQRRKYLTFGSSCGIIPEQWRVPTLFNEVHDELTVDLPPDWIKRGTELVVETMRTVPTLRSLAPYLKNMPLYVDPKLGNRWGDND